MGETKGISIRDSIFLIIVGELVLVIAFHNDPDNIGNIIINLIIAFFGYLSWFIGMVRIME